jgi:hypothetical protein
MKTIQHKTMRFWSANGSQISQEEWETAEKERFVKALMEGGEPRFPVLLKAALMELPLETLIKHYPYRGAASDDCHTQS